MRDRIYEAALRLKGSVFELSFWGALLAAAIVVFWIIAHPMQVMNMIEGSIIPPAYAVHDADQHGGFGGQGTPGRCDCGTANQPGQGLNIGNPGGWAGRYNGLGDDPIGRNSAMTSRQAVADANGNPGNIGGAGGIGGNGPMGDNGGQGANAGF